MAPTRRPAKCQVCTTSDSKYTCAQCFVVYCSVPCFKQHKQTSCTAQSAIASTPSPRRPEPGPSNNTDVDDSAPLAPGVDSDPLPPPTEPEALRPLTSLRWPYVPEESAYPDPLKRDDPKTLQLRQYEAIATSPDIRRILAANKDLPALLTSLDKLRGREREDALERALGLTAPEIDDQMRSKAVSEDVLALRKLAEAVEVAVRGGNQTALGLDWGE